MIRGVAEESTTEAPVPPLPMSAKLLGIVFALMAGMSIPSSLFSLACGGLFALAGRPDIPREVKFLEPVIDWVLAWHLPLTLLELVSSTIVLVISVQFLRRRGWARTGMEILNWLVAVLLVPLGVGMMVFMRDIRRWMPPELDSKQIEAIDLIGSIFGYVGLGMGILFAFFHVGIALYLRKKIIRDAMVHRAA